MSKILLALAALAAGAALPAYAAPPAATTRLVAYGDLDLSSPAGQARLEQRIATAVREVCGTAANYDLRARQAVAECREATFATVVRPAAAPVQAGTR